MCGADACCTTAVRPRADALPPVRRVRSAARIPPAVPASKPPPRLLPVSVIPQNFEIRDSFDTSFATLTFVHDGGEDIATRPAGVRPGRRRVAARGGGPTGH